MLVDQLHKFIFEDLPVKGAVVTVASGWQELLDRRAAVEPFPTPIKGLLGEMLAAGLLMQSSIKFSGALVLQLHGDGPLSLAVSEVRSDMSYRLTAQVHGTVETHAKLAELVNVTGEGRCVITLDSAGRAPGAQPYQGIVPLFGDGREPLAEISQALEHYMLQSEQLDTRLILTATDRVAAGLMLQRLPRRGSHEEQIVGKDEDFNRIAMLASTLTAHELQTLAAHTLLRRLFAEEDVRCFAPLTPRFCCTCSRARVAEMLRGLGDEELRSIVTEHEAVEVDCEFCGESYNFDAVDVGRLLTPERDLPPSSSDLH